MSALTRVEDTPRQATTRKAGYDEYLAFSEEGARAEWVNGEIIELMPPKEHHQSLVEFLVKLIGLFNELFGLGRLIVAPFELKLTPDGSSREPDLMFIAKAHLERLTPDRVVGPPDLIIEVVSDDSVHRDRVDKFDEYEAAGVPEYWVLDNRPGRQRAQFYRLGANGQYQTITPDEAGVYHSAILSSFWINVDWLWTMPSVLALLAQIAGPNRLIDATHLGQSE